MQRKRSDRPEQGAWAIRLAGAIGFLVAPSAWAQNPGIVCEGGACQVQQGRVLVLLGDSSASGYRYHQWQWLDAAGNQATFHLFSDPSTRNGRGATRRTRS